MYLGFSLFTSAVKPKQQPIREKKYKVLLSLKHPQYLILAGVAGSRERSDPLGHCCCPECCLGPVGSGGGQGGTFISGFHDNIHSLSTRLKIHSLLSLFPCSLCGSCWSTWWVWDKLDSRSGCDHRGQILCHVSIQDPKQIISCIDFRYITDVLTEEEALGKTR